MQRFLSVTLAFLLAVSVASASRSATIHVSPSGSIQAAVDNAQPGDVIKVHGGVHSESVVVGDPSKPPIYNLEIAGEDGATLDGTMAAGAVGINIFSVGNTVHGLTVRNYQVGISVQSSGRVYDNTFTGNGIGLYASVFGDSVHFPAPTSLDNNLVCANANGIIVEASQKVKVKQNTVLRNGVDFGGAGISVSFSDHCSVTENVVSLNGNGVTLFLCNKVTAESNVVTCNGWLTDGIGVLVQYSDKCSVNNNVVNLNGEGIVADNLPGDDPTAPLPVNTFTYNIALGNRGWDAQDRGSGANVWAHNLFGHADIN